MSVPLHLRLSLPYPRHLHFRSHCRSVEPCDDLQNEEYGSVAKTTSSTVDVLAAAPADEDVGNGS